MKKHKTKVLLTCEHHLRNINDLSNQFNDLEFKIPEENKQTLSSSEMKELLRDVKFAIIGDDIVDYETLQNNRTLKHLIKWGVGIDSINLASIKANDINFYNTPGVFSDEVADLALGFLLSIERGIHITHNKVVTGKWEQYVGNTLRGKKGFVIGLGSIGQEICNRLSAFGIEVSGYDPFVKSCSYPIKEIEIGCKDSDYIFLACNLTEKNKHLIDKHLIAKMKRNVVLINIARGGLVCEKSVIDALLQKKIKAVGFDVFESEPPDIKLLDNKLSVFGSHGGSSTTEAINKINFATLNLVRRLILEEPFNDLPVKRLN